jgi:hypothetical protein
MADLRWGSVSFQRAAAYGDCSPTALLTLTLTADGRRL